MVRSPSTHPWTRALCLVAMSLALAACSQPVLYDIEGVFDATAVVTSSTYAGSSVGDEQVFIIEFSVTGNDVTAVAGGGATLTGTRTGNTIEIGRTGTAGALTFESSNTWTFSSDDAFAGHGRVEYSDGSVVTVDVTGTRQ